LLAGDGDGVGDLEECRTHGDGTGTTIFLADAEEVRVAEVAADCFRHLAVAHVDDEATEGFSEFGRVSECDEEEFLRPLVGAGSGFLAAARDNLADAGDGNGLERE
jgi:hypothetical protein